MKLTDEWKNLPISNKCGTLVLNQYITAKNMEVIRMGHIPEVMEDHWFIWCDDSHIRIHRSWTGICMFEAEYRKAADDDGYVIGDVKVNLDDSVEYALFMCLIRAEIASAWKSGDSQKDIYDVFSMLAFLYAALDDGEYEDIDEFYGYELS